MAVHISPVRIQRIKQRWEREVLAGLERQERRLDRARDALARVPVPCQRERDEPRLLPVPLRRATSRRDGQLELFGATRRPVRLVQSPSPSAPPSAARGWQASDGHHYTVAELSEAWNVSPDFIRDLFREERDIVRWVRSRPG